ncbi:MAG: hypothetical protein RIT45_1189 [Pseudomonadota bacterium]
MRIARPRGCGPALDIRPRLTERRGVLPRAAIAAAWAFAAAPALWVAALPASRFLAEVMTLDAAAYPVIAAHLAAGDGPTFDGETPTNGVQPLWLLLHLPWFLGAERALDRLWVTQLLAAATTLLAIWRWSHALRTLGADASRARLAAALLGGSGYALYVLASGMEAPLALWLLAEVVAAAARRTTDDAPPRPAAALALGGLAGLAVLARLDHALVLAPLGLWLAGRWRRAPSTVAAATAGAFAPLLPYGLWNLSRFGALLPVSGIAKRADVGPWVAARVNVWLLHERVDAILPLPLWATALGLALAALAAVWLVRAAAARLPTPAGRHVFGALGLGVALHAAVWLLAMREFGVVWHVVAAVALVSASVALVWPARAQAAVWALAVVLLVGWVAAKRVRRPERRFDDVALAWMADLPAEARVGLYDGWFVRLRAPQARYIAELSGLVGDAADARDGKRRDAPAIARRHRLDYVIEPDSWAARWVGWREVGRSGPELGGPPFPVVLLRRPDGPAVDPP